MLQIDERRYWYMADEQLLCLIEAKDPAALSVIYERHSRPAYSLALRMLAEKHSAEELVQEAFLKVWRYAGSYRAERGSARVWILSIVHNQAIDFLRRKARQQSTHERYEALTAKSVQHSEAFEHTCSSLSRARVRQALETLPKEQLQTLELIYFHEHTHTDSAVTGATAWHCKGPYTAGPETDERLLRSLCKCGAWLRLFRDRGIYFL